MNAYVFFTCTANGEMASRFASGTTTPTSYFWNTREMLTRVSLPSGAVLSYTYLPEQWRGWRIASSTQSGVTSLFVWDAATGNPIATLDHNSTPFVLHGMGAGLDQPVTQSNETAGAPRALLTDHLGTVQKTLDSTGAQVAAQVYSAFGQLRGPSSPPISSTLGYVGRSGSDDTSLVYMRAREYSANLERFTSRDPAFSSDPGGPTPFTYAGNNPTRYTDPMGLQMRPFIKNVAFLSVLMTAGMGGGLESARIRADHKYEFDQALQYLRTGDHKDDELRNIGVLMDNPKEFMYRDALWGNDPIQRAVLGEGVCSTERTFKPFVVRIEKRDDFDNYSSNISRAFILYHEYQHVLGIRSEEQAARNTYRKMQKVLGFNRDQSTAPSTMTNPFDLYIMEMHVSGDY